MLRSKIAGVGHYVPEKVVTNDELSQLMDTSDAWIQERTGIMERRYVNRFEETTSTLGTKAARVAIERSGIEPKDIDFIVFATLSPDYYFPGSGVLLQRQLGIPGIGALDIRNQCSGFVYGLSVADQFVRTGMYRNVLVVGAEAHSIGLDYTTRGRNVTVIFGDGGGAVVLQPTKEEGHGILSTHLHADGTHAEQLSYINPGSHSGVHGNRERYGFPEDQEYGGRFLTKKMIEEEDLFPYMDGQYVFKHAVQLFPEVIMEALTANGYTPQDLKLLVPHQANLRISQFVQKRLRLQDDQVYNNIQKYGNTTAASIPIALSEAWEAGMVQSGDLICLAAFGSGFTWASALIRW
jgi:3-oxoacyl-[acyl-carrier-protein] synthase-3